LFSCDGCFILKAKGIKMKKGLFTGNEIVVKAAIQAGAQLMFGYPITPSTEILESFAEEAVSHPELRFIQTEDEISAGFGVIGAVLGGKKAFTATAGPGTVLMQDAISMAEAMRLPFVGIITQRGGPSTGTVIYSQQEVTLTCFGGNTEGLRFVYSPSNLQDVYDLTIAAFNSAWQYRFPAFLLTDGYLAKAKGEVRLHQPGYLASTKEILGKEETIVNIRNTYSTEEELFAVLKKNLADYQKIAKRVSRYRIYQKKRIDSLIFAHGSVASACLAACEAKDGLALFQPLTLRPFPRQAAKHWAKKAKKIFILESSAGQFARLVKEALSGLPLNMIECQRPALGITPKEVLEWVR